MSVTKRIVCLANSRKLHGRCIAGAELAGSEPTGWLRPVSVREHQEVCEYERQYEDGSDPELLDIIDIPLLRAQPRNYQRENWLPDPELLAESGYLALERSVRHCRINRHTLAERLPYL